jgi:hypothetical protein
MHTFYTVITINETIHWAKYRLTCFMVRRSLYTDSHWGLFRLPAHVKDSWRVFQVDRGSLLLLGSWTTLIYLRVLCGPILQFVLLRSYIMFVFSTMSYDISYTVSKWPDTETYMVWKENPYRTRRSRARYGFSFHTMYFSVSGVKRKSVTLNMLLV